MSIFSKTALSIIIAGALNVATTATHANVMLTFDVSNVFQNDCTGAMQPICANTVAGSFVESMVIASTPLNAADTSFGSVLQSSAFYDFATSRTGTPYTSLLSSRVSNPVTGGQSYTQIDNTYDNSGGSGSSSALIYSDVVSDTRDNSGNRTQQEYKISYSLLGGFTSGQLYTNLTSDSLFSFFSNQLGNIGSFDELGSTSTLDPIGLGLNPYVFTEYTGDIALVSVQSVPEPGMFVLCLAGFAGIAGIKLARKAAAKLA